MGGFKQGSALIQCAIVMISPPSAWRMNMKATREDAQKLLRGGYLVDQVRESRGLAGYDNKVNRCKGLQDTRRRWD